MFQHTVDRATRLTGMNCTIVVAACHHRQIVESQMVGRPICKVVWQPVNRDTAAGLFLPLAYLRLRSRDPRAIVVVHPSDHFIYPEMRFLDCVRQAIASVETMPERLLLLGVQPDRLEVEYGWIRRGAPLNASAAHPVHTVSSFLEKPAAAQADAVLREGGLWNTLVLVATVESLWQAGWACFPDMMPLFERLESSWDTSEEAVALETLYQEIPKHNFSSGMLQREPDRTAVMELSGVLWSDWGNPLRIAETIRRIGKTPTFPLECLDQPFTPHTSPQAANRLWASV
jgi:mannose-1-phosphate guanylyltransferase